MTQTSNNTYGKIIGTALANYELIYSNRSEYHPSGYFLLCEEIRMSLPDPESAMANAVFLSIGNAVAKKRETGSYGELFELTGIPADRWVDINSYMKKLGCRAFLLPAGTSHGMEYTGVLCEAGWSAENRYSMEDEEMGFLGVLFTLRTDE